MSSPISTVAGRGGVDIISLPIAARLSSSESLLPYAKKRLTNYRKLGLSRASLGGDVLADWGFDKEEAQDLSEALGNLTAAYDDRMNDTSTDSD